MCRPLHVGGDTTTYEIVVSDEKGRRTCTARLTRAIPPAPRGATKG
ncbi:hypothetical protein IEQ31_12100 [Microbispora camponoti]|uniref:Uncharacterized protein n=1 Tax=Microbispora bryophytorum subsp. camponoti TaxID=1677852 RepID=A0ABR8L118_9ACTN|nr:hypothetical protein [Microbispora camponoti]